MWIITVQSICSCSNVHCLLISWKHIITFGNDNETIKNNRHHRAPIYIYSFKQLVNKFVLIAIFYFIQIVHLILWLHSIFKDSTVVVSQKMYKTAFSTLERAHFWFHFLKNDWPTKRATKTPKTILLCQIIQFFENQWNWRETPKTQMLNSQDLKLQNPKTITQKILNQEHLQ